MTACIRIYYVIVIATGLYGIITDFTDFQRIHFSLDALKLSLIHISDERGEAEFPFPSGTDPVHAWGKK